MSGFYEPLWLVALAVIPALAGIYFYMIRKKKQEAIAFSRIAFVKSALGDAQKSKRTHILFIVALAAIGLLVIGLADPHIPIEQTKQGTNVILVLDVSGSMQATDYQPSRLEAAKTAAETLVKSLDQKDSAGVVIFESGATTAAYLSQDKDRVEQKIAAISPKSGETAIGDGLALGVDMAQSVPNKKSVIILLSDGVNNAGVITPDEAVALAKSAGIQVYTVGLGTSSPTVLGYDWLGNPQYATLDETTLKSIADQTDGKYYKSVDEKTLNEVYSGLTQNIVHEKEDTSIKDYFIFAALILLGVEFWLRYGRGRIIQ
ncbi:MAG: VWA domain-containing protein [Methanoregula sp.]|nr:VWA domain-containing protein [Methanoregula sp.]